MMCTESTKNGMMVASQACQWLKLLKLKHKSLMYSRWPAVAAIRCVRFQAAAADRDKKHRATSRSSVNTMIMSEISLKSNSFCQGCGPCDAETCFPALVQRRIAAMDQACKLNSSIQYQNKPNNEYHPTTSTVIC
jgi:hypothetical protein